MKVSLDGIVVQGYWATEYSDGWAVYSGISGFITNGLNGNQTASLLIELTKRKLRSNA